MAEPLKEKLRRARAKVREKASGLVSKASLVNTGVATAGGGAFQLVEGKIDGMEMVKKRPWLKAVLLIGGGHVVKVAHRLAEPVGHGLAFMGGRELMAHFRKKKEGEEEQAPEEQAQGDEYVEVAGRAVDDVNRRLAPARSNWQPFNNDAADYEEQEVEEEA